MRTTYGPVASYTGDNSTDEYTFDFKIEALSQLLLIVLDDEDTETERCRGNDLSDFFDSVDFDDEDGGGTVTLADNLDTSYKLFIIQANDAPTQPNEYRDKFSFTLKGFELALDFIVGAIQRASWLAQRSIRLNDAYTDTDFDLQMPLVPVANASLVFSDTGLALANGPTKAELLQASADTLAAEAARDAALAAQTAAETAQTGAETAQTGAETAQAAAETAQAAAETAQAAAEAAQAATEDVYDDTVALVAGVGGFVSSGPFSVTENDNSDLSSEVTDKDDYTQVDYIARIVRDTGVFSRVAFSIFYRNSAWELEMGEERHNDSASDSGVTFTVDGTTAQINAAVANDGEGNATIDLKKLLWAAP